jgi:hypothetical protein
VGAFEESRRIAAAQSIILTINGPGNAILPKWRAALFRFGLAVT